MQSTLPAGAGWGRTGVLPLALSLWLGGLAVGPLFAATGTDTRFDYVAVFPVGTDAAAIEIWRQDVLGRVHRQPCLRDRPCVARMLRSVVPGSASEVIGFDLMREIAGDERATLLAAAVQSIPGTALRPDSRPSDLGNGLQPLPTP